MKLSILNLSLLGARVYSEQWKWTGHKHWRFSEKQNTECGQYEWRQ